MLGFKKKGLGATLWDGGEKPPRMERWEELKDFIRDWDFKLLFFLICSHYLLVFRYGFSLFYYELSFIF